MIAYWFYQTQACNGDLPDSQSVPHTEGANLLSTLGGGFIERRAHPDGDMTLLQLKGDLPDGVMFQGWDANPNLSARRSPAFIIPGATIGASSNGFPSVRSFPTRFLELPTMSTPSSPIHRDEATRREALQGPPSSAAWNRSGGTEWPAKALPEMPARPTYLFTRTFRFSIPISGSSLTVAAASERRCWKKYAVSFH